MKKFEYGQRVLHNKTDLARIVGQDDETTYKIIYDNDREWVYADAGRLEPVISKWTACGDQMPEQNGYYLVSVTDISSQDVYQSISYCLAGCGFSSSFNEKVTHWMPLPTPPKDQ